MVIDCHGHYTTAPRELEGYRQRQIASLNDPLQLPATEILSISNDQIREEVWRTRS